MNKFEEIKEKWTGDYPKSILGNEIEWLIEQVEIQQKLKKINNDLYLSANQSFRGYGEALREIDKHIKSTNDPIPLIIETLKNILPEYK